MHTTEWFSPAIPGLARRVRYVTFDSASSVAQDATPAATAPLFLAMRPEFTGLAAYACQRLNIARDHAPTIYLAARDMLPARVTGQYHADANVIYVRDGLTREQIEATICHETAHAYQRLNGLVVSEDAAFRLEARLLQDWRFVERRAR